MRSVDWSERYTMCNCDELQLQYDELMEAYESLLREYDEYRDEYREMELERDQYQRDYECVERERDEYESSLHALQEDYDELQKRYTSLEAIFMETERESYEFERFVLDLMTQLAQAAETMDAEPFREYALELARQFSARVALETLQQEDKG